jgi:hypothetical protein
VDSGVADNGFELDRPLPVRLQPTANARLLLLRHAGNGKREFLGARWLGELWGDRSRTQLNRSGVCVLDSRQRDPRNEHEISYSGFSGDFRFVRKRFIIYNSHDRGFGLYYSSLRFHASSR